MTKKLSQSWLGDCGCPLRRFFLLLKMNGCSHVHWQLDYWSDSAWRKKLVTVAGAVDVAPAICTPDKELCLPHQTTALGRKQVLQPRTSVRAWPTTPRDFNCRVPQKMHEVLQLPSRCVAPFRGTLILAGGLASLGFCGGLFCLFLLLLLFWGNIYVCAFACHGSMPCSACSKKKQLPSRCSRGAAARRSSPEESKCRACHAKSNHVR